MNTTLHIAVRCIPRSARLSQPLRSARCLSPNPLLIKHFSTSLQRRDATGSTVEPPDHLSDSERKIFEIIKHELRPEKLDVQDISGGCGSMYALDIVSAQFEGLPVIKQHRLVNKVLGEEIKKWHGVQLKTKAP